MKRTPCAAASLFGLAPAAAVPALLDWLTPQLPRQGSWVLGVSGVQGSGKSTLAQALVTQARRRGVSAVALSLDDFYLSRRQRRRLAARVHPLLQTRGVPGTHDLELALATLDALPAASQWRPVSLPRFDKGRDTRVAPSHWRCVTRPPRLVILEGWCLSVTPQSASALRRPLNALERNEDADGRWRRWVNRRLADYARRLWPRLDALVLLQAPGWAVVRGWREQAERALAAGGAPRAMDHATLQRFLMHYERLSREALVQLPRRADYVIRLDRRRRIVAIVQRSL